MDPESIVKVLTDAGPWAVAIVLGWLLRLERAERIAAQQDASGQRDKRAAEMRETTEAVAELGEATRKALDELGRRIKGG